MSTELFLTFPTPALKVINIMPLNSEETGGRFRVWLFLDGKPPALVWDRKVEGGFPELKLLVSTQFLSEPAVTHRDRHITRNNVSAIIYSLGSLSVTLTNECPLPYCPIVKDVHTEEVKLETPMPCITRFALSVRIIVPIASVRDARKYNYYPHIPTFAAMNPLRCGSSVSHMNNRAHMHPGQAKCSVFMHPN